MRSGWDNGGMQSGHTASDMTEVTKHCSEWDQGTGGLVMELRLHSANQQFSSLNLFLAWGPSAQLMLK